MGRLAVLLAYGPEVRAFLQSGLVDRLAEEWEIELFAAEPGSAAFAGLSAPPTPLAARPDSGPRRRWIGYARAVERRAGAPCWLSGWLAGERAWRATFRQRRIGAALAASRTSARTAPALRAAARLGLPSVVLANSWKDAFAREASAPAPAAAVGVATVHEAAALERLGVRARVCGSLHVAAARRAPARARDEFLRTLGLDPRRPVVCYAASKADRDEPEFVDWLARELARRPEAPQLLVRPNPMDRRQRAFARLRGVAGAAVLTPRWEWLPERDWCCALPADAPLWRACLDHCALAAGAASTVALEFAAWGKPSVNLGWGAASEAWEAEFYAPARDGGWAQRAASPLAFADRLIEQSERPAAAPRPFPAGLDAALDLLSRTLRPAAAAPAGLAAGEAVAP